MCVRCSGQRFGWLMYTTVRFSKFSSGCVTQQPYSLNTNPFCLLLQAVANESGLNFISVKGPELLNMVSSTGSHVTYILL